ncbi:hypothetical protein HUJ05_001707, partial [Dendroctonus ponderosae]
MTNKQEITIIMGDFNAKVGRGSVPGTTGDFGLGERNERRDRLIQFCQDHNLLLTRSVKHISSSILQAKKSSKSKRVRTIFTPEQLERLEAEFERQQYMVGPERLYLAHTLQLTEAQ